MLLAIPVPADVKDVLYSVINEIGREKIRMEVAANMDACEKYCKEVIDRCTRSLGPETDDETLATLCEALLHFMLTASVLPTERKVKMHGADLDLVIPSTRVLEKNPDSSLVIQVVRGDLAAKVKRLSRCSRATKTSGSFPQSRCKRIIEVTISALAISHTPRSFLTSACSCGKRETAG